MEHQTEYQKMYLMLFNYVTTAIRELNRMNVGRAKEILMEGQQKAEEIYLNADTGSDGI